MNFIYAVLIVILGFQLVDIVILLLGINALAEAKLREENAKASEGKP